MTAVRVLHLVGSADSEFLGDLSRLYARDCLEAVADPRRYDFYIAYVTPDGRWRFPTDLSAAAIRRAEPLPLFAAVALLRVAAVDVVVPHMFCRPGMTSYRALLEMLGIPYVGNPPEVMALALDKAKAKAVVGAAGVAVPGGEVLTPGQRPSVCPPAVVKPADSDNSLGVTLVTDPEQYDSALASARAHSDRVLVEDYVELGREVRCGVLDRGGELVCLPLEEYNVDAAARPIRGHSDKLARSGRGDLQLMAKDAASAWIVDPDDPITRTVWDAARKCHVALGCRHYSLFDFRVDPAGRPWFLEAGLYCSFARTSVISMMAVAAGIELDELFRTTLDVALTAEVGVT